MTVKKRGIAAAVATAVLLAGFLGLHQRPHVAPQAAPVTMNVTRYEVGRAPDGLYSQPFLLEDAQANLLARAKRHAGPFRIARKPASGPVPWGPKLLRPEAVRRLEARISTDTAGSAYLLRSFTDGTVFRERKIVLVLNVVNTEGTSSIDHVYSAVFDYFARAKNEGIYSCKVIPGTSTWSQHAYANAIDISVDGGVWIANAEQAVYLDRVFHYLQSAEMSPYVSQLLWQVPDHFGHIHVSGAPFMYGTPACARR